MIEARAAVACAILAQGHTAYVVVAVVAVALAVAAFIVEHQTAPATSALPAFVSYSSRFVRN